MTAPSYVASGAPVKSTGSVTPLSPAGSVNDILILTVHGDESATLTTPTGWTALSSNPQSTGASATATGNTLWVFWRRATGTLTTQDGAGSFDTGNHTVARIHRYTGCVTSVSPILVEAGNVITANTATPQVCADITTTSPQTHVIIVAGHGANITTANYTTGTSTFDSDFTAAPGKRADDSTNDGVSTGGGCAVWDGEVLQPVVVTGASLTMVNSSAKTSIVLALAPAAVSVSDDDPGSGVDNATVLVVATGDTGSGADIVSTRTVPTNDTASGAEAATAKLLAGDTGSAPDVATIRVADTDTGTGLDSGTAPGQGVETGNGADAATVRQYASDTGSGVDNASATNTAITGDTALGAETSTVALPVADTAAGVDTATVVALVPSGDTGSSGENAGQLVTAADTGSFADGAIVLIGVADAGSFVDNAAPPIAVVFGTDTGAWTEPVGILLTDGDSFGGAENARVGTVGVFDRLLRTFEVDADPEADSPGDADGRTCTVDVDPEASGEGDPDNRTLTVDPIKDEAVFLGSPGGLLGALLRTFTVDVDPNAISPCDADNRTCVVDADPESSKEGDADNRTLSVQLVGTDEAVYV